MVSILSAFYDLFVGVSSFVAGRVADRHGYRAAFLMAAFALIGAAIAARFVFQKPSSGQPEDEPVTAEPAPELA